MHELEDVLKNKKNNMIGANEDRQQKQKTEIGSPARETERLKVKVGIGSEETSEGCVKQLQRDVKD